MKPEIYWFFSYLVFPVSLANPCLHYLSVNAFDVDANDEQEREPLHKLCGLDDLV